jgi:hypothetical protein
MKEIDLVKEDRFFQGTKIFSMVIFFFALIFGHKAIKCSLRFRYEHSRYSMNNYLPQQRLRQPSNKQSHTINHVMTGRRTQVKQNNNYKNNNRYDLLFIEPECYNFHIWT